MPKRTKTPPPSEDEPRYLVVVHPYPLNANLLLHADRRALALWLACCIGKDALYAMYYKPASPGMVIIEVDRYFDRFDLLLGKHLWSLFFKHSTEEDNDKASKVFWCHYNTDRMVQKNGWKRVDVEEHWFHDWSPRNDEIEHPYPKTTYCDVPAEAQTGVPLCRPLPKDIFTPPPPRPRPTVGSAEWIHSRGSNVSSEAPSSSRRRRGSHGGQIAPSDSASMISSPTAMSGIDAPVPSSTASSSVSSRTPSALGTTPAPIPARPPGLSAQSVASLRLYESFDWSDEVEIRIEAHQDDVPTSTQSGASTSRAPSRRTAPPRYALESGGVIDADRNYEYDEEDIPKRSIVDAMKDIFNGAPGVEASIGDDAGSHDLEEEENYLAWNYPPAVRTTTRDWTPAVSEDEDDPENPWDGYDAPRWEPPTRINIKGGEVWICPEHGPTCKPGICEVRAHVEARRRMEKERDERLEAKMKRMEKWRKAAERKERKKAQAEGREVSDDLPPHFASHRHRGAGGSSSDSEYSSSDWSADFESHSPPPFSPQDGAAGAEGWAEEGSLWTTDSDGDNEPPKVSIPSSKSVTGSNRVEGEDEARGPAASEVPEPPARAAPTQQQPQQQIQQQYCTVL